MGGRFQQWAGQPLSYEESIAQQRIAIWLDSVMLQHLNPDDSITSYRLAVILQAEALRLIAAAEKLEARFNALAEECRRKPSP